MKCIKCKFKDKNTGVCTYPIKATAEDTKGLVGPEGTLSVTMPRNKAYINTPFINFLQNHPYLFPILQTLLQRLGPQ